VPEPLLDSDGGPPMYTGSVAPGFPSSKLLLPDNQVLVYYQHGKEIRMEVVPLATFDNDRAGFYSRWKTEL